MPNIMPKAKKKSKPSKAATAQALKYEKAWHELYYKMPRWRQEEVVNNPHGREAKELTKAVIRLGEKD
jgi:hypothetical protein